MMLLPLLPLLDKLRHPSPKLQPLLKEYPMGQLLHYRIPSFLRKAAWRGTITEMEQHQLAFLMVMEESLGVALECPPELQEVVDRVIAESTQTEQ